MPTPITFRDFAALCYAIYQKKQAIGQFTVSGKFEEGPSGFQGAIYTRPTGKGFDRVVTVAGTQLTDVRDVIADAGFGGDVSKIVSPLLGYFGTKLLWDQVRHAEKLIRYAGESTKPSDRIFITGHSLGGGIAQIASAQTGVPAVAICAPAVSHLLRDKGKHPFNYNVWCLRVKNDPINKTGAFGKWLGREIVLNSPRTGLDAHSIELTWAELNPAGRYRALGARAPFDP